MEINKLVESRLASYKAEADLKINEMKPIIEKVNKHRVSKGQSALDENQTRNLAIVMDNALMESGLRSSGNSIFETTDSSNVAFLGVQLPIIAAMVPSLILNDIATVQALDRRSGSVFYLDMKYGTTKDGLTSGNTFVSAKSGHGRSAASRAYGSQLGVADCTISGAGLNIVGGTLANRPVKPGTVKIVTSLNEIFVDNGVAGATTGQLVSSISGAATGTINYSTGVYSAATSQGNITSAQITYAFGYEAATAPTSGVIVPSVDFNLTAESLTAIDFPLQSKYTLAAALDLKKAHGMDLESEMVKLLGNEIKFEIDHYGIDLMLQAAKDVVNGAGRATTFNATVGSGQEFVWRKFQFNDSTEELSNLIFNKTLRGMATFLVCGNNVARLVKQLKPDFTPVSGLSTNTPTGPHKIGTLNGRDVFQDPFLGANDYFGGYKGDSFLMSGFVYAPYIPLFSTPTIVTSDLVAQKGFMSSSGYKVINSGLFAWGSVSGL